MSTTSREPNQYISYLYSSQIPCKVVEGIIPIVAEDSEAQRLSDLPGVSQLLIGRI